MKPSQIYRKAAELMDADKQGDPMGCCYWIYRVCPSNSRDYDSRAHSLFKKWFPWDTKENTWGHYTGGVDMDARVLALLLMSEITKAQS